MGNSEKSVSRGLFGDAIGKCDEIRDSMKRGLSALGANSNRVKPGNPRNVNGSVDIDKTLKHMYPNDSRWDYVVGYCNEAFFIEVHPADTSNVDEMVKKVKWLIGWLETKAPDLKKLHKCGVFHWIPSGRFNILPGSRQYKIVAANRLLLTKQLALK